MLCNMSVITLTSADLRNAHRYVQVMESLGVEVRILNPGEHGGLPTEQLFDGVGGLMLTGGPDVDPLVYGATPDPDAGLELCRPWMIWNSGCLTTR